MGNVVRPAAFNGRPTAEQEIAQRGAEIFAEFQQRKEAQMVERIAQRVVELLRADPIVPAARDGVQLTTTP